jgi:deazaflavin-dependent oxidoreductase (nitroreductase family)
MDEVARQRSYAAGLAMSRSGWTGMLTTRGRRSGRDRTVPMGFVEEEDGTILIGTGLARPAWALNLREDGRCRFQTAGLETVYQALELHGDEAGRARRRLRQRYGGMSAYDDPGPAFVLHPEGGPVAS